MDVINPDLYLFFRIFRLFKFDLNRVIIVTRKYFILAIDIDSLINVYIDPRSFFPLVD